MQVRVKNTKEFVKFGCGRSPTEDEYQTAMEEYENNLFEDEE